MIVKCPSCGQANNVPPLGTGKRAVCAKCKSVLPAGGGGGVVELTDSTFAASIAQAPFVVDFWAAWCGPCRMIAPVIEELASQRSDVRFGKLNVDQNPRTSAAFGVQSIPLLIFFRDGAEAGRVVGAVPKSAIENAIRQYLG